jgi:hypothetical protein
MSVTVSDHVMQARELLEKITIGNEDKQQIPAPVSQVYVDPRLSSGVTDLKDILGRSPVDQVALNAAVGPIAALLNGQSIPWRDVKKALNLDDSLMTAYDYAVNIQRIDMLWEAESNRGDEYRRQLGLLDDDPDSDFNVDLKAAHRAKIMQKLARLEERSTTESAPVVEKPQKPQTGPGQPEKTGDEDRKAIQVPPPGMDPNSKAYLQLLMAHACQAQDALNDFAKGLGQDLGLFTEDEPYHPSPIKGADRIFEKKALKYDGNGQGFSNFTDISRQSLVFTNPGQLVSAIPGLIKKLQSNTPPWAVTDVKNRFDEPTPYDHNRDILLNLRVPLPDGNVHITELQLHLKDMHAAKTGKGLATGEDLAITEGQYKRLAMSCSSLLKMQASGTVRFNDKALAKLQEFMTLQPQGIESDEGDYKFMVPISGGHPLYMIKRYLDENQSEITMFNQVLAGEYKYWAIISAQQVYDQAWERVEEQHQPNLAPLYSIQKGTFKDAGVWWPA